MDQSMNSSKTGRGTSRLTTNKRRFWTREEELSLIAAVKELIADGWKSGNGWRGGFYKQVERMIHTRIPGSDLRGEPHVNSKLTVWKREHGYLFDLFTLSGPGLDPATNMIVVDDDFGAEYIKRVPEIAKLRGKPFPYYDDWCEIFGKDRATGVQANDFATTVQNLLNTNNAEEEVETPTRAHVVIDGDDDSVHANRTPPDSMQNNKTSPESVQSKQSNSRKRKSSGSLVDEPLISMMGTFMNDTKDALVEMTKALNKPKEESPDIRRVYEALNQLEEINKDHRLVAAHKLVNRQQDLALFFTLNDTDKASFVKMILRGSL